MRAGNRAIGPTLLTTFYGVYLHLFTSIYICLYIYIYLKNRNWARGQGMVWGSIRLGGENNGNI